MSLDRPGETELELVERRGCEAAARAAAHDAAIAEHRRNGTSVEGGSPAFSRPQDRLGFWEYGRG